ncbi:MAG: Transcriptional regulator, PaaX family [Parcubacteria group bacterium GW2011_GWA2_43_9b]|uniref:CRISPR-associated endoribonuclease Cas2 n=1 Tax=Candidatus Portnoybacteria bacterium RIFCSPLOWO2_02_FULL_39_11 TaxID=1802001 RepID=A0A1G2FR31_9BACT|nr:MAG: Transcriptional regulator, PaaX family [Parcubacteria group bacterium GW2011_GWA2_43_9b]OGZ40232.1 MAG: CRISPR-associated endonuclease Cas2 [Candidatus Portnoybacteria bacterium RIFCSPLOWO2_02_FULL_39_11]
MKRNEIGEKILLTLYDLTVAVGIIFSRDSLWTKIQKMGNAPSRRSFVNSFNSLQRSGFWRISKAGKYQLTTKGAAKLEQLKFRASIKRQKWDSLWRIVIFDISEDKKVAREALRRKLKRFGFYHLQKSVFVFPYDCEKEIAALADFFEENDNIEYIIAKTLGGKEREIKDFFDLS